MPRASTRWRRWPGATWQAGRRARPMPTARAGPAPWAPRAERSTMSESPLTAVRLDKWLWAARFFKTRSLAVDAIGKNRVDVNGSPAKPSREVRTGDRVLVREPG